MTGNEMLREIDRREYYNRKECEHIELVEFWWYAVELTITGCGIVYIIKQFMVLWDAIASCF